MGKEEGEMLYRREKMWLVCTTSGSRTHLALDKDGAPRGVTLCGKGVGPNRLRACRRGFGYDVPPLPERDMAKDGSRLGNRRDGAVAMKK